MIFRNLLFFFVRYNFQEIAPAIKKEPQAKILSETANLISLEDPAPGPGVHGKAREKACE